MATEATSCTFNHSKDWPCSICNLQPASRTEIPITAADVPDEDEAWRAFREGYDAWAAKIECPYEDGTPNWRRWHLGNFEAKQGYERP